MAEDKTHQCPVCGTPTKKKFCSKQCFYDSLRKKSHTVTEKLGSLDNTNRCWQCGKPMPLDRYSAYCEDCEMHLEFITGYSTDLTNDNKK